MTVDVRIRTCRPDFNPTVAEPTPTCESLNLLGLDSPPGRTNQKQGLLFGKELSRRVISVAQHTVDSTWVLKELANF